MQRIVTVLLLCGATLALRAEDQRALPRPVEAESPAPPQRAEAGSPAPPAAVPILSALPPLRAGAQKVYREVDGEVRQIGLLIATASGTDPVPLPTSPAEIEKLRQELKTLRVEQIDALDVESLLVELARERKEARSREAWKALQQIRKDLLKLEQDHPGTPAADLARQIQSRIPDQAPTPPTPGPASPFDSPAAFGPGKPMPDFQPAPAVPRRQPFLSPFEEP